MSRFVCACSILTAATISRIFRLMVPALPITSGNRFRASCCVRVEPPSRLTVTERTAAPIVRRISMPVWL